MVLGHRPVLVEEVVSGLLWNRDGLYLDATVGAGGHAEALLKSLGEKGRLVGVDCDDEVLPLARERLAPFGARVQLLHGRFDRLPEILAELGIERVDGLLLDLGVSSFHLDRPERGFSFQREGPLDMRMDHSDTVTAEDLVARLSREELVKIFQDFGEERFAKKIAQEIVEKRRREPIRTTTALATLIARHSRGRDSRIHPATRCFQALRIAVNQELDRLDRFLGFFPNLLVPGGRGAFLAYHSLEDRRIKRTLKGEAKAGRMELINRKPIRPTEREIGENPRARSARLRLVKRLEETWTH